MLRFGSAATFAPATEQIITTFKKFIECLKYEKMQIVMDAEGIWDNLKGEDYLEVITKITGTMCQTHPDQKRKIFAFLLPYLKANYTGQRLVTGAIFAELINNCLEDAELLEKLVNCLLNSLADTSLKRIALRGMANIVSCGQEKMNKYAPTVLYALMSSIDERDDNIAMEAMLGLARVFDMVSEERIAPILINICNRIRPAFDKKHDKIRASSFALFGALHRFGDGVCKDTFFEQMHSNFPAIILHLNDENDKVRAECKMTLARLAPLFRDEEIEKLLTSSDSDYDEFVNFLSRALIAKYAKRINYFVMTCVEPYFKSEWDAIRANAAIFVGCLLGNLTDDMKKKLNLNPGIVTKALISLLREKSPKVREKTANAMSLLYKL